VENLNAHVLEIQQGGSARSAKIEVLVDTEAGIVSSDLTRITKAIRAYLDGIPAMEQYRLTVSSPGLDRPLQFPWQYRRHVNRNLEVAYKCADEVRTMVGMIVKAGEESVTIETDGEQTTICYSDIVKATVQVSFK
jgi:ribosome maturation factor RimP